MIPAYVTRALMTLAFALCMLSPDLSRADRNIFTEWHPRYRRSKPGVLIY